MAKIQGGVKTHPYPSSRPNSAPGGGALDEVTEIIHASRDDLKFLWKDTAVKEILRKRRVRLEEGPGL